MFTPTGQEQERQSGGTGGVLLYCEADGFKFKKNQNCQQHTGIYFRFLKRFNESLKRGGRLLRITEWFASDYSSVFNGKCNHVFHVMVWRMAILAMLKSTGGPDSVEAAN